MNINWPQIVSTTAVIFLVPLIMRYLAKRFPPGPNAMPTQEQFSDVDVRKWNRIFIPVFLIISSVVGWVIWVILNYIQDIYTDHAARISITPQEALVLPAMIGGLTLGILPVSILGRRFLKERYALYEAASSRQYGGMDSKKLTKPYVLIGLCLAILGSAAIIRSKVLIFENRIESCGPIVCKTYLFSEIIEIGQSQRAISPSGSVMPSKDLFLRFQDGSIWTPFLLRGDAKQDEVAAFVALKTALIVQKVDVCPEQ